MLKIACFALAVVSLAAGGVLAQTRGTDTAEVGEAQVEEILAPEKWLGSADAQDYNGDGQIDVADFRLWYADTHPLIITPAEDPEGREEPMVIAPGEEPLILPNEEEPLVIMPHEEEPLILPREEEPTDEGVIEEREYLEKWLASGEADDYDADGQIDETDFRLWLAEEPSVISPADEGPEPVIMPSEGDVSDGETLSYEDYLKIYGMDLNEDGQVDEADYEEWKENPFLILPTAISSQSWGAVKQSVMSR